MVSDKITLKYISGTLTQSCFQICYQLISLNIALNNIKALSAHYLFQLMLITQANLRRVSTAGPKRKSIISSTPA